jgi:hypothetical protein
MPDRPGFPLLKIEAEHGFINLEFGLVGHSIEGDEFHLFCAGARQADSEIAFNVLYPMQWTFDPPKGAPQGLFDYHAGMALVNAQPLHESFIQVLAGLYGVPTPRAGMANFTEVSAVVLGGNPHNVVNERVQLKIFFGAYKDAPIPYAEAFLNLDVPNGIIQLHEKDPEYRPMILQGLICGTPEEESEASSVQ